LSDLALYQLIAWSAVSFVAGYMTGRWDAGRMAAVKSGARKAYDRARGMRVTDAGEVLPREKPRRFKDDDKELMAIKSHMQIEAERRMHATRDRLTLDYWQAGVHVEFCPRLESVSRFICMSSVSRRKHWRGNANTYHNLLSAFVHRGLVIRVTAVPPRYEWSRAWSTCRRRIAWWQACGYQLPPPLDWGEGGAGEDE